MRVGDTFDSPAGFVTLQAHDQGDSRSGEVPYACRLSCVGESGESVLLYREGAVLEIIRQGDIGQ